MIKEDLDLTHGIGEIEGMIRQAEAGGGFIHLGVPGSAHLARLMSSPGCHIERAYRVVSAANLRAAVDGVRTVLAELVGELRAGMPVGEQVPSPELN